MKAAMKKMGLWFCLSVAVAMGGSVGLFAGMRLLGLIAEREQTVDVELLQAQVYEIQATLEALDRAAAMDAVYDMFAANPVDEFAGVVP